ncbi:hypothetical protein CONLIGDRAFT_708489 [Coniochaeta ligniaria NRRL 30616]|uniref:C2H2-type domain-containing protein n=1 Tax=Coniochaeta ligniaria NRRL 30616 TaxID=1408157 RepID=A0A1J7IE81_9PEZI|nr:hypothetical protein CONLIGDRAFT_708489 [Coniochaeta ligniaria NRRL 30616]
MSINTHEIYDLARSCNNCFKDLVQQDDSQAIEEYQQRFWAWANGLAVFAKPYLSLDARLANEKYREIREIILLLLGVLKKNLDFVLGLKKTAAAISAEHKPSPDIYAASSETSAITDESGLKPRLRRVKTDLRVPIYGIDGAISRLEKLARAVASASQDSISRRVLAFAQNERDEEYEELAKVVVRHLYPPGRVPSTLGTILVNSMLFRYYRILYQRKRHEKEKSTAERSLAPQEDQTTNQSGTDSSNLVLLTLGAETQLQTSDERKSEPDSDAKTALHSINLDAYKYNMDSQSERVNDQASSAPQTGKILYPRAPEVSDEHGNFKCPICYALLPKLKVEKRNWRDHVNEDLQPYVCISENCAENLRFFATERLWLQHMRQAHTTTWIRHLHMSDAVSWVCPIYHAKTYTGQTVFSSHDDLYEHMTRIHSDSLKETEIAAISRRSETKKPRSMEICPLCDDRHSPNGHAADNDTPDNLDDQEQAIRDSANHARLAPFVGRHLKSLAFFVLRKLLDEPDEADEAKDSEHSDTNVAIDSANSRLREDPDDDATELSTLSFDDQPNAPLEVSKTPMTDEESMRADGRILEQDIPLTPTSEVADMYDLLDQKPYNAEEDHKLRSFFSRGAETTTTREVSPNSSLESFNSDSPAASFHFELDLEDPHAVEIGLFNQNHKIERSRHGGTDGEPSVIIKSVGGIKIRCTAIDIVHGTWKDGVDVSTLIVYEFRLLNLRKHSRVASLTIECQFSLSGGSRLELGSGTIDMLDVVSLAPHDHRELRKRTQINATDLSFSSGITRPDDVHMAILEQQRAENDEVLRIPGPRDAERGMLPQRVDSYYYAPDSPWDPLSHVQRGENEETAGPARPPGTARTEVEDRLQTLKNEEPQRTTGGSHRKLERSTSRDAKDSASITGSIAFTRGRDGPANTASWTLMENRRNGIPETFRTAVLLRRKGDIDFSSRLRLNASVYDRHTLRNLSNSNNDEIVFKSWERPTNRLRHYDVNNLDTVDLTELVAANMLEEHAML